MADLADLGHWLKNKNSSPIAIVLDSSVNGLSFARSLGRRGVPVLMLDSRRLIGAYTRYAKFVLMPPVERCPEDWLALLEFASANVKERAILFASGDAQILFVAQHERRLHRCFCFVIPDLETVESILNKRAQYQIASSMGIPIPKTWFPDGLDEAKQLCQELEFPCILKPYISHTARQRLAKRKVVVVESRAEMIREYGRLASADLQLMIQEIVHGGDDALYGYLGFWDELENERAWLGFHKLRQYPSGFGDGSLTETTDVQSVREYSQGLLRAMNYRGFVEVEFKCDARDHTWRLIEINPRSTSFNQLAINAGIDFPWIGYEYLAGRNGSSEAVSRFRPDIRCVDEELDFQAWRSLARSGRLNLRDWLLSIHGAKPIIFAWDDPMPIISGFGRLVRNYVSRLNDDGSN